MAITVSFLCKTLFAVLAHEGTEASVHADVVHHVAKFCESVATGRTHQQLILTTSIFVLGEQLHVTPFIIV